MISLQGVTSVFAGFKPVTCTIKMNSVVKVAGGNGVGKTALLKILSGLSLAYKGEIEVNKYSLRYNIDQFKANAQPIFAQNGLYEDLTVKQNIALWSKRWSGVDLSAAGMRFLDLEKFSNTPVYQLSSGLKRKVALAMLVARPCKIWIIDEIDSYLDEKALAGLQDLVKQRIYSDGIVIYTAHSSYLDAVKSDEIALETA